MSYRTIGNTIVEWDDNAPFTFCLKEEHGPANARVMRAETINLAPLRTICEDTFLLHIKEYLIEARYRVALSTVRAKSKSLISLFTKIDRLGVFDTKVSVIDEAFLLCIGSVGAKIPRSYIVRLATVFGEAPASPLFAKGLQATDFPIPDPKKGRRGELIDSILAKALTQNAVAYILDQCDKGYAEGKMDIGLYSFAHLAFAVFCRPASYRQIRVSDFNFDPDLNKYSIKIIPVKSGTHKPTKTLFSLNEPLGILLSKQRQHVVSTYGHLVSPEDIEKLALFPARKLAADKTRWLSPYANYSWGMYQDGAQFSNAYSKKISEIICANSSSLSANTLRHTVATLLAQAGASAKTIQSVLRHVDESTCSAYVDIAFHGLIGELSEAMFPAFESHLPGLLNFRSKTDLIAEEKRIRSEDLETGKIESTGECGKSIACENAPIVCYTCFRFRPCWDADHSINLKIIQREIEDMERRGKPFEHMVSRARTAKNRIILVMNAADRYRDSMQ